MTSRLTTLDWIVVASYFVAIIWIGLAVHKKAGSTVRSFFTGDGSMPWWLVAASLVATSFASDTPLWVTGLIRQYGIHAVLPD